MSIVNEIVKNSRATHDISGDIEDNSLLSDSVRKDIPAFDESRDRFSSMSTEGLLRSSKQVTLEDQAILQRVAQADAKGIPDEGLSDIDLNLRRIITEEDENNPGHYKHAAYFAQTGNRSGFSYVLETTGGATAITFVEGIYVTTNKAIVDQIRKDITTNAAIAMQIREVTVSQYRQLLEAAEMSKQLLARSGGLTNSTDVVNDAQEIIAAQNRRIAELEAKLNSQATSREAATAATGASSSKPFNFGNGAASEAESAAGKASS